MSDAQTADSCGKKNKLMFERNAANTGISLTNNSFALYAPEEKKESMAIKYGKYIGVMLYAPKKRKRVWLMTSVILPYSLFLCLQIRRIFKRS